MKLTADYHTHTNYSDGENTVSENVARAATVGLKEIAITDHAYAHWLRGLRQKTKQQYLAEIRAEKENANLTVLAGLEFDLLGESGTVDFAPKEYLDYDVFLMGVHVLVSYDSFKDYIYGWSNAAFKIAHIKPSKSLIRYTTRAFVRAVEKYPIDVITHLNHLCFTDAVEVAKCCRDNGTYLEISAKKTHFSDEELFKVAETGVKFLINSDAHSINRIGDYALAEQQINRVGISPEQIDNIDGRLPKFRFSEYKKRL